MRIMACGLEAVAGNPAAFLYGPPEAEGLPNKYIILPVDADAGHLASCAQYLALGSDASVFVHESVMEFLNIPSEWPGENGRWEFADAAARRGVSVQRVEKGLRLTSDNHTVTVDIAFVAYEQQHLEARDAPELMAMASV